MEFSVVDGSFLRAERIARGWKIDAFAEALGISRQYLSDIEMGRRLLKRRPDLVKQMAELLEVPVTKLYRSEAAS